MPFYLKLIVLICCSLLEQTQTTLHLYKTLETDMSSRYFDCLYAFNRFPSDFRERKRVISVIAYCRRPTTSNQYYPSNNVTCHGTSLTFATLRMMNITGEDLYRWNAPIDLIDQYMFGYEDMNNGTIFCNCTTTKRQSFGSYCEYSFPNQNDKNTFDFDTIIDHQLNTKKEIYLETADRNYSCLEGIEGCESIICLDWRQICNGIRECFNGEDEIGCMALELNSCDETKKEYRCSNGFCIPRSFVFDYVHDCPDHSDERRFIGFESKNCFKTASIECDEFQCGWLTFPCGDGHCLSHLDLTLPLRCINSREHIFLQRLFNNITEPFSRCDKLILCLSFLYDRFLPINCVKECGTTCWSMFFDECTINDTSNSWFFYSPSKKIPILSHLDLYTTIDWKSKIQISPPTLICSERKCRYAKHVFIQADKTYIWLAFLHMLDVLIPEDVSLLNMTKNNSYYHCKSSNQIISTYRLMNGIEDCYGSDDESNNLTWIYINDDKFDYFQCSNEIKRIPRRFFLDRKHDCFDRSDEPFILQCTYGDDFGCNYLRQVDLSEPTLTIYQDICDELVRRVTPDRNGETDESNCQDWPCDARNNICNGMWNCIDGRDELNCPGTIGYFLTRNLSHCQENEHYCWNLVPNATNQRKVSLQFGCIPFHKAGDGSIDCFGASDERMGYCRSRHPWQMDSSYGGYRFLFPNSKSCYSVQGLCISVLHVMPLERYICPWLYKDFNEYGSLNKCPDGYFLCESRKCIPIFNRCNDQIDCQPYGEDEWFCDMIEKRIYRPFSFRNFDYYPNSLIFSPQMTRESQLPSPTDEHYWTTNFPWWYCQRGVYVSSKTSPSGVVCLCPPSFYGDRCQFQYQRITLYLRLLTHISLDRHSLLRLFCYFLGKDDNESIHILDFEEIVHNSHQEFAQKQVAYLTRHRAFRSLAVRIDVYQAKRDEVISQSSWYFNISFPFLPVNRLIQELRIEDDTRTCDSFSSSKCIHGICRLYINVDQSFCQCDDGWTGDRCEIQIKEECRRCAPSARCAVGNRNVKPCVCPLERIGRTCHVKFDTCQKVHCENHGTCLSIDERASSYTCVCSEDHFGDRCQFNKSIIVIQNHKLAEETAIVHLVDVQQSSVGFLTHIERRLFPNGFHDSTRIAFGRQAYLPSFMFVQTFVDAKNFYGDYYLIAFVGDRKVSFLETSVLPEYRCPYVVELLRNRTLNQLNSLARVKYYHNLCIQKSRIRCFHDEIYMCLCDQRNRTDCLIFDYNINNCSTDRQILCQNQALCLQILNNNIWNFHCVCQKCYYGNLCQFTTLYYAVSLDALIGTQVLQSTPFRNQASVVFWSLSLVLLLLIIGSISNLLSIAIFARQQPRQCASGIYLLIVSITAQICLIVFAVKYICMIIRQMNIRENSTWIWMDCFVFEFLLSVLPAAYDWLVACVAIDRSMTATQGTSYNRNRNKKLAKYIIILIFLLIIGTCIHKSVSRHLINDPSSQGHVWCILTGNNLLMRYESIINVIHLIGPFTVNVTSTFFFLTSLARRKTNTTVKGNSDNKSSYRSNFLEQMILYRPFVVSPVLIAIFSLPRLIFTFAFACIQTSWQKNLFLVGYLISFVPLASTFFIFVVPSPAYKEEFRKIIQKLKSNQ